MLLFRKPFVVGLVALGGVYLAVAAGCSQSKEAGQTALPAPARKSVVVPVVTETPDEIRAHMKTKERDTAAFEEDRLKLTTALETIRKSQGVEGYESRESPAELSNNPTAYVDPKTGRVAWRAMACWNPDCPGRGRGGGPFLFSYEISTIKVGPDGKLDIGSADASELMKPVYCPACKSNRFIGTYDLPESMIRERQLKIELEIAYKSYAKAAKEGMGMPTDVRSPQDILQEINNLPKLFLLSEPGKVKQFDAITAPVGRGLGGT